MRLLITGASGLLGLNLALEARNMHQVVGMDRCQLTGVPFEMVCADLLERGAVDRVLDTAHPDWLIHCAALANLEACEADPELARCLNASLPGDLAAACKVRGVKIVQISTDSVFDGIKSDLYTEEDVPNPLSLYAETKLQGEQAVLSANPDAIVARVNFYGFSLNGKRSLAEFFVNNLSAGERIKGFTDLTFNPTFVGDLADLLLRMLAKDLRGLYHTVSADVMSKYSFGVMLARRFGWDESLISPESVDRSGLTARRAHNLGLSVHKLFTALGGPIPAFSTGLDRFYSQFQQGYPQNIRSYQ
ncbi:MAG: SDR family oxidoreductase [Chloroflexi bacterium]|nr:SDR family oxidoreductase [Chloroflexota bacterium]